MSLNPDLISVRDLSDQDIPFVLRYWFHSPSGFLESMGADPSKMGTELEMEKFLRNKCAQNQGLEASKINALVITYEGNAIGNHVINPLVENDHGIFHAHLWEPSWRHKGIGVHSYPQACQVFMDRFNLKRILFKTPIQNRGAIRLKEKLGIRFIGEEVVSFGIITDGTHTKVFELNRDELPQIQKNASRLAQF